MPVRVQRRRTKGWRAPADAKYVGRGSRFGNPWAAVETSTGWAVNWAGHAAQHKPLGLNDHIPADDQRAAHSLAVELYELWLRQQPSLLDRARRELAGRPLMCWCPDALACHVDVLLRVVNEEPR